MVEVRDLSFLSCSHVPGFRWWALSSLCFSLGLWRQNLGKYLTIRRNLTDRGAWDDRARRPAAVR